MATITALLVLIPHEHEHSKTPHDPQGRTGAPLYGPRDCSAHVKSRWSFGRTTAVSPKYMRLQRRRFASSARLNPRAEVQASISRAAALYLSLYPSYHIVFPFNEPARARLRLGLGTGAGGLEKIEDVVGLIRSFVRSAERTTAGFGARGRRVGWIDERRGPRESWHCSQSRVGLAMFRALPEAGGAAVLSREPCRAAEHESALAVAGSRYSIPWAKLWTRSSPSG
ncbi:uncharacterized protein CC84DRAFT_1210623 [Paraphaeosphaeria sporulosa]|uniref:Uncharacterized protein n=1 Tax=Paraphaeosphaeria sporulosa TaxID=1460663 RepID=A0A177BTM4_9PLEO|nr:uncharacterized protein CC84DRAFT_1210623 [Paraphaeosphaeria sporulosa]OAF98753.1 hypothetical protein CC84DRAFT_1210623 [Paraphaeosphaeria sporulosa]